MEIIFERGALMVGEILREGEESLASSLMVLDKPLIVSNIQRIETEYGTVEEIFLPESSNRIASLIEANFPSIQINEYREEDKTLSREEKSVRVPLNSYVTKPDHEGYGVTQIVYPWDILTFAERVLQAEVKETSIDASVTIPKMATISGPVIIGEDATLDDYCKVKGPAYIGAKSKLGMGVLIRDSIVGECSSVGFNCEVGRSYLAGRDILGHHNVVLDSVLGWDVSIAGLVGTTNVRSSNKSIRYKLGEEILDTGRLRLGAVIGHDSAIGGGVIIMPGRFIPPHSIIRAGTVVSDASDQGQPEPPAWLKVP